MIGTARDVGTRRSERAGGSRRVHLLLLTATLLCAAASCGDEAAVAPEPLSTAQAFCQELQRFAQQCGPTTPCDDALVADCSAVVGVVSDPFLKSARECVAADRPPLACLSAAFGDLAPTAAHRQFAESFCANCALGVPGCTDLLFAEAGSNEQIAVVGRLLLPLSDALVGELTLECTQGMTCMATFVQCAQRALAKRALPEQTLQCLSDSLMAGDPGVLATVDCSSDGSSGGGGAGTGGTGTGNSAAAGTCDQLGAVGACGAGFKCSLVDEELGATEGLGCVMAGSVGKFARCETDTECQEGLWCDSITRVCKPPCVGVADCDPGAHCVQAYSGTSGDPIANLRLCTAQCNPVSGSPCSQANGAVVCMVSGFVSNYEGLDCEWSLNRTEGEACSSFHDCGIGLTCALMAGEAEAHCAKWCTTPDPVCPGGTGCWPLYDGAYYGACLQSD